MSDVISGVQIHWFPGHMKKAINEIGEKIKLVDVVVELIDARIPFSSINPYFEARIKDKPKILVLTKVDLCDESKLPAFCDALEKQGYNVCSGNLNDKNTINHIKNEIRKVGIKAQEKYIKKGLKPQPTRVMIIGIPNVGKSTLINKIAKRAAAGVENRPGFTRSEQWVKVNNDFLLLDTPGVLPFNYENKENAAKIALTGAIRDSILPNYILVDYLLDFLKSNYPDSLKNRFDIENINEDHQITLKEIAIRRGLLNGKEYDLDKAMILLLKEFKNGQLGRITLDTINA